MKLRKIIKEEVDDLEWIREIKPNLKFYVTSKLLKPGDIISVTGEMAIFDVYDTTWVNNLDLEITTVGGEELHHVDFKFVNPEAARKMGFVGANEDELAFMEEDGDLIVNTHQKKLNESDDFGWIRDIGPYDIHFKIGDIIKVHNLGDEQAYLNWLGNYSRYYKNGDYGSNIVGKIIKFNNYGDTDYIKIETTKGKLGDHISFPTYDTLNQSIKKDSYYDGIDLLYEIIN